MSNTCIRPIDLHADRMQTTHHTAPFSHCIRNTRQTYLVNCSIVLNDKTLYSSSPYLLQKTVGKFPLLLCASNKRSTRPIKLG
jgi:hypothetical protein